MEKIYIGVNQNIELLTDIANSNPGIYKVAQSVDTSDLYIYEQIQINNGDLDNYNETFKTGNPYLNARTLERKKSNDETESLDGVDAKTYTKYEFIVEMEKLESNKNAIDLLKEAVDNSVVQIRRAMPSSAYANTMPK